MEVGLRSVAHHKDRDREWKKREREVVGGVRKYIKRGVGTDGDRKGRGKTIETEGERNRDRQTDRQTDRDKDRERKRDMERWCQYGCVFVY